MNTREISIKNACDFYRLNDEENGLERNGFNVSDFEISFSRVYPRQLACDVPGIMAENYAIRRNSSEFLIIVEIFENLKIPANFQYLMSKKCMSDHYYNCITEMPLHVQYNITKKIFENYYDPDDLELTRPGSLDAWPENPACYFLPEFVLNFRDSILLFTNFTQILNMGHDNVMIENHHIRRGTSRNKSRRTIDVFELDAPTREIADGNIFSYRDFMTRYENAEYYKLRAINSLRYKLFEYEIDLEYSASR